MNYYRRYVGDYLRDTSRLSILEHGAYNLLLDYYYAEEKPIPSDLDEVYRMVRALLPEERRAVDKVLFKYFKKTEDGYRNARADEEIAVAATIIETAKENGKLGGRPKKNPAETQTLTQTETVRLPLGYENPVISETQTETGMEPANNHPPTTIHQPPSTNHQEKAISPANAGSPLELLPSNIPYREIVGLYNATMEKLAKVRDLNNDRRKLIRVAWQANKKRQSIEFWREYFEECSEDDFLNGTGPYGNGHENWKPDFDYLMRPKVITKTYEKAMSRNDAA